jgi:coenzyme F420-reducing hydrogenase delta subunit/ferredoxin
MENNERFEPKIIAYLCTWCSYTGADTAGIARLKSPANVRAIRVPCSGRVSPEIIMRTFDQGADGVLVLACHIGECHYDTGNHRTAKRLPVVQSLMSFAGLEPERLRLDYVSASEGERFSRITNEFTEKVRELGPVRWRGSPPREPTLQPKVVFTQRQDHFKMPSRDEQRIKPRNGPVMNAQELLLREKAAGLLSDGIVTAVIGYESGTLGNVRPVFIYEAQETERLVWNRDCSHNLVVYLPERVKPEQKVKRDPTPERFAVVVKPCDSRAVNVLMAENQIDRSRVHLIGMTCDGMENADGTLQNRCAVCSEHMPLVYDTIIGNGSHGEDRAPTSQAGSNLLDEQLRELEALSPQERMDFWLSQFDRCIRCYACRQACPMCNCPTCLYERDDSFWVGAATGSGGIGLYEKRAFHLGRAFHLAGRCVGCNACEQACPVGIPISLLNRKLVQEMALMFGHQAGVEPVLSPVVTVLAGPGGATIQVQEG